MKNNDSSALYATPKIIAIVGMAGSGKSEVGEFFKQKGLPVLRFGSVIDEGLKEEGLPWSAENNTYYREKIRKELGMAAVAKKMLPKIEHALQTESMVILDGLYSWEEYTYLKEKFPQLQILCVYARPDIRYQRLSIRQDRSFLLKDAQERDRNEIENLNKGGPIAMANYLIKNETTKEALAAAFVTYWEELHT